MEPEERGFDYYSSSRTPRKEREEMEECEDVTGGSVEGEGEGEDRGGGENGHRERRGEKRSSREREEGGDKRHDSVTTVEGEGGGEEDPQSGWEEEEEEKEKEDDVIVCTEEDSMVLRRLVDRNSRHHRKATRNQLSYSRSSSEHSTTATRGSTASRNGRSSTIIQSDTVMVEETAKASQPHLRVRSRLFNQSSFSPTDLDPAKSQGISRRSNSNSSRTTLHTSRATSDLSAVVNGWESTDPPECRGEHRTSESATRRGRTVTKNGETATERSRSKRRVISIDEDSSLAEDQVPRDLLCNGPTASDVQSGRGIVDCTDSSEDDEMTVDTQRMDCAAEQDSNSKSTRSSEERLTGPHVSSEIDNCVDIDPVKLFTLFERVVAETEDCSVEVMEKMLSTFDHLVFRYRLRNNRRQLNSVSHDCGELL